MKRIYLDWNATTKPLPKALDAMRDAAERAWGNPSSIHADGRAARAVIEDARTAVAELGGVSARDVVLTSGGTEANNLALRSAFVGGTRRRLLTSRLEHPSIVRVAEALEAEGRAEVRWLRVLSSGRIDLADLERALAEAPPGLLALQVVNHETGVIQPWREATSLARAAGALVHVDAVQAWGKISASETQLFGADTASLAGHKIRGPKAIGALLGLPGVRIVPVLLGGSQEKGVRPGTLDPILAAGLGTAARHAARAHETHARLAVLRDRLELELREFGGEVSGADAPRAPHVSNVRFRRWSGPELVAALDLEGVSVSSGSACSAGTVEASPVIRAMVGDDGAAGAVRVSMGEETTDADIDAAIAAFGRVLAR